MLLKKLFLLAGLLSLAYPASAGKIAILSDTHVTPGNQCDSMLRIAVDEINSRDFDLVVVNGDLSNEGSDAELRNVASILSKLRHKWFAVPGNHENNWSQSAGKTFIDIFGADRFVTMVDSTVIIDLNCGPFMKMGDGHIKQEDLHWLRATLDSLATPGRRVLSMNHYPLLSDLDNYRDYISLLEDYPVIAHINGHYHTWRAYNAGGENSGNDLPCVMVRALDMRDGTFGYSEVEFDADSVRVYNKNIGTPRDLRYSFAADTRHSRLKPVKTAPLKAPDGYDVVLLHADKASVFTRPGFTSYGIVFGNSLGEVVCIDRNSGKELWKHATGGASLYSRPVALDGGDAVAVPANDGIHILSAGTGEEISFHPSKEGPYVADGVVNGSSYLQGGYKTFESRDIRNGNIVWSFDSINNYCQAEPATDGDDIVFGAWDTYLRCLDAKTGKLRWKWSNGKSVNMLGPGNAVPVISGDKVFIVAPDRFMTAIDRKTGHTLWRDNSVRYRESMGHSEDYKTVYAKTMDGELVAVDASAPGHTKRWTLDLGIGYDHAPCPVIETGGIVYAGSRRGIVTMTDVSTGTPDLIASLNLGRSEINGIDRDPISSDIFITLTEGTIYRVSRK